MERNVRPKWKGAFRVDIVDDAKQYDAMEVPGIYVIRRSKTRSKDGWR